MAYVVVDKEQLETDITTVADAIREKGGTSEPLVFPSGMADAIRGIQSGSGTNWLDYVTNIYGLFQSVIFDVTELNVYFGKKITSTKNSNAFAMAFQYAVGLESVSVDTDIEFIDGVQTAGMFRTYINDATLKKAELPFLEKVKLLQINSMFTSQRFLKEIVGIFDLSFCTNVSTAFTNCQELEEIRFKPNTINLSIAFAQSSLLSAESIQSIIDGLATVETSQTLTFHADVKDKLTEEQIASITSKNWTLA